MKMRKATVVSAVLFAALAIGLVPSGLRAALAQNTGERTVSGTVLDDASKPVASATVYLKDQKTKSIRSFTSLANGPFYFAQVNKAKDFDLWAEKAGNKSAGKTVSSWDARTDFINDLKLK